MTSPPYFDRFVSSLRGGPKFCLEESCSPWIWTMRFRHGDAKSWTKRYSNTMRMQNQAKLAARAHRGHTVKHMSKCLQWYMTAMPGGGCWWEQNRPPKYFGVKSKFAHKISSTKRFTTPYQSFRPWPTKKGKPPFQIHHFLMKFDFSLYKIDLRSVFPCRLPVTHFVLWI